MNGIHRVIRSTPVIRTLLIGVLIPGYLNRGEGAALSPERRRPSVLKDLPVAALDAIATSARVGRYFGNEYLFREHGDADSFYLVRKGRLSIEILSSKHTTCRCTNSA